MRRSRHSSLNSLCTRQRVKRTGDFMIAQNLTFVASHPTLEEILLHLGPRVMIAHV